MPDSTSSHHYGIGNRPLRADRQEIYAPCGGLNESKYNPSWDENMQDDVNHMNAQASAPAA